MSLRLGALACGLALAACARVDAPAPAPAPTPAEPAALAADLVVRDVRVFDGERVIARTSVAVLGESIVAVAPDLTPPPGATVVDGAGMTLLPGLIDAHTHVQSAAQLRQALIFGVTTELDMFTPASALKPLRRIVGGERGRGHADLRSAGVLATAPGGHGTEYGLPIPTLTRADEAAAFVDARLAEGSDYLKIVLDDGGAFAHPIPTLGVDVVRALVDAAHARGARAVVHVSSQREATAAIEAGADGLAHVFFDGEATPELVRLAAARRIFVADTLVVIEGICGERPRTLADDPELAPHLAPEDVRALRTTWPKRQAWPEACAPVGRSVLALHRAGVPILASTDAPNPGTVHGASLHEELELLTRAGLAPTAALAAATSAPADAFGLADRGRIAVGKRADLLLVRGDPTAAITATRAIEAVWRGGARVDRAAHAAEVAAAKAEVEALRRAPPPPGSAAGLVSDFEAPALAAAFGSGWQPATDALIGGTSTVALARATVRGKRPGGALRIEGAVMTGEAPARWAGAIFFPGAAPMQPANLGAFRKVRFKARSADAPALTVMLFAAQLGAVPARKEVALGPAWQTITVDAAELGGLDWYDVTALFFGATQPGSFSIEIDDVRLE